MSMKRATEIYQLIEEDKKNKEFLPTGFKNVDKHLDGGFLKKEVVVLGAFTGIGKSMLAGQIFYNIVSHGFKSAYFSLEISNEMVLSRITGQIANIKPSRLMHGLLMPEEFDTKAMAKAKVTMYEGNMDFYDESYMLGEIEKSIKENAYEFVVIDFIQNIFLENNMDEYTRLTFVSIKLQKLAKETNSCILLLSQLSNRVGSNNAQVVEYKGSGGIAQIADLGFFIERGKPITDLNGQPVGSQSVTLSLRKNRRGISGISWNLEFVHPGGIIKEKEFV